MRLLSAVALLVVGCATHARTGIEPTFAAPLSDLSGQDDVQPAMRRMASAVVYIHKALAADEIDYGERARILAWLSELESAARTLSRSRPTDHPRLDEHLDEFLRDIEAAKTGVHADPPNYYPVGHLSGSCMYCHQRDAPADFEKASMTNDGSNHG
ncbi:MAG: hypothetical protein AAFQ65_05395 [Myxococcota bacterium]